MDKRYRNTLIADLWSDYAKYDLWCHVESGVAQAQARGGVIPTDAAHAIGAGLDRFRKQLAGPEYNGQLMLSLQATELDVRHDVVAFLRCAGDFIDDSARPYLHFGLTSSDLVDTAAAIRMRHAEPVVAALADKLEEAIARGQEQSMQTPMLGRTHGQPAEPITLGLRFHQWHEYLLRAMNHWISEVPGTMVGKMSGPVGAYTHFAPEVETMLSQDLGFLLDRWSHTQVVPRDYLARWANAAAGLVAACGKIATDFRLMAARGEAHEQFGPMQVGSSSMPHKRNPVTAEKICGLVRLARGYAAMLQPIDLWEDRDISHSCVERVAVPDLLHVVCHALESTASLLANARWDTGAMSKALQTADRLPYSAWQTLELITSGYGRPEAELAAADWARDGCFGKEHEHPQPLQLLASNPVIFPPTPQFRGILVGLDAFIPTRTEHDGVGLPVLPSLDNEASDGVG